MTPSSPSFTDVRVGEALPTLTKDVTATTIVLGALASRDWRPMHHDHDFAVNHNGTRNIFMNTPNFATWFERYLTDWTGPRGRLGRMTFRMRDSVFPGEAMQINGTVRSVQCDEVGCGWAEVEATLTQGGRVCVTCTARIAVAHDKEDNPWSRRGERWRP